MAGCAVVSGAGVGSVHGDAVVDAIGTLDQLNTQAHFDLTIVMSDLEIGETLGVGTFGRVRLVRHAPTGAYYALKTLRKDTVSSCLCSFSLKWRNGAAIGWGCLR